MAKSVLSADRFHNEEAAFAYVEAQLWPNGPVCPHCGNADRRRRSAAYGQDDPSRACASATPAASPSRCASARSSRTATCRCACGFRPSTCFAPSKKGISTRQLQRMLGCGMKTAWHLGHRIRLAMDPGSSWPAGRRWQDRGSRRNRACASPARPSARQASGAATHNVKVLSLVERGGNIRSTVLDHRSVGPIVRKHVHKDSRLVTDKAQHYKLPPVATHEYR